MKMSLSSRFLCAFFALCIGAVNGFAANSTSPHYVVTNDDSFTAGAMGVSFYSVGTNGQLTFQQQVITNGAGIGGGYFAPNRVAVLDSGTAQCVYASEAFTGDIVGISVSTLEIGGSAFGSPTDSGSVNGIGLVLNSQYLYASFTESSTIGTFLIQPGCGLSFVSDVSVLGLQGGTLSGMAINGGILVATYNDGSIESFNISGGTPVSNGDEQNSTAYVSAQGATYPNSVDISQDGHFAIFGDTASNTVVEVSDISSGKLTKTVSYTLSSTRNSSNVMLSPDETLLYISNSQGDSITAAGFNATTGALSGVCTSTPLRNYVTSFSYVASLALENTTGNGGVIYAAEFGTGSAIAMVQVGSSGGKCTLTELSTSPVPDTNSFWLLSIAGFPPRPF
jgi:6-phosphogluconolactonase (cycloisomerase 2 family)